MCRQTKFITKTMFEVYGTIAVSKMWDQAIRNSWGPYSLGPFFESTTRREPSEVMGSFERKSGFLSILCYI